MSATISVTNDALVASLGRFLADLMPQLEIIRGQANRVPTPATNNFLVMQPGLIERLSTNIVSYQDEPAASPLVGLQLSTVPTALTVQLDVYGPASAENASIAMGLLRSPYGAETLRQAEPPLAPLYTTDPRQIPLLNSEDQYEDRWTLDAVFQANPTISVPQQFADQLDVGLINVEATYPAGGN